VVRNRAGITKMGCLTIILLAVAAVYVAIPIGETYFRYLEYKDAMRQEARFRSGLPNERIIRNLKIQVDSLGLPEEAGAVTITRASGQITIEAEYEEAVRIPGMDRVIKVIRFQPRVTDTY
jgi:hypothetical protein